MYLIVLSICRLCDKKENKIWDFLLASEESGVCQSFFLGLMVASPLQFIFWIEKIHIGILIFFWSSWCDLSTLKIKLRSCCVEYIYEIRCWLLCHLMIVACAQVWSSYFTYRQFQFCPAGLYYGPIKVCWGYRCIMKYYEWKSHKIMWCY